MTTGTKSLTVVLALVLALAPAVALASCSQGMSGMSETEMAGMMMPPMGLSFSEVPNVSCCIVAPAEITSSGLTQADATATIIDLSSALPPRLAHHQEGILSTAFLAPTPPTQAELCVFLI